MTVGPWKPIYLHTYTHRITDLRISSNVSEDLSVTGQVTFALNETAKDGFKVSATIKAASGAQLVAQELSADDGKLEFSLKPEEVELWFPIGYGKQALHTFTVALKDKVRFNLIVWTYLSYLAYRMAMYTTRRLRLLALGVRNSFSES